MQPKDKEQWARKVLGDRVQADNSLQHYDEYLEWVPMLQLTACLDGYFTAEQLEAIAWWMRNKGVE